MWKVSTAVEGFLSSCEIRHTYTCTHARSAAFPLKLLVTGLFFIATSLLCSSSAHQTVKVPLGDLLPSYRPTWTKLCFLGLAILSSVHVLRGVIQLLLIPTNPLSQPGHAQAIHLAAQHKENERGIIWKTQGIKVCTVPKSQAGIKCVTDKLQKVGFPFLLVLIFCYFRIVQQPCKQ